MNIVPNGDPHSLPRVLVLGYPRLSQISRHGLIAYASTMDTPGVMTKTVRDAAFLFDVLAATAPDVRDDRTAKTRCKEDVNTVRQMDAVLCIHVRSLPDSLSRTGPQRSRSE